MKNKLILSSGPTQLSNVTKKMLIHNFTNQDLDSSFMSEYKSAISLYNQLIKNEVGRSIVLTGEAMLALEAACLNFIEVGDRVLVVSNGIFGAGFEGLVENAGGVPSVIEFDWDQGFDVEKVLEKVDAEDFKVVTMVHVETPTGVCNDVASLCRELRKRNIISIVDSVSAIGGEMLDFDEDMIDVLLGGSQKVLSLPADLSFISLSDKAIDYLKSRTPVKSYYLNLLSYIKAYEENRYMYTQCIGSILALKESLIKLVNEDYVLTHREFAEYVRSEFTRRDFQVYAKSHFANTVTAFYPPSGISANELFDRLLKEKNIVISGGLGVLNGQIIRVGHMGENNKKEFFDTLLNAVDELLDEMK